MSLLGFGALASGVGALAGAAGSYSGGKKSRKLAEKQFNAQMDESIQRRVKDAQAAGVHPLFALGASVGASPTMHAGSSSTGGALGEGIAEAGRTAMRYAQNKSVAALQTAQIGAAQASATRDEAEAQLALSRAKQVEQNMMSRGRDGLQTFPYGANPADARNAIQFGPVEYVRPEIPMTRPSDTSTRAGYGPSFAEYDAGGGHKYRLFAPELQMDEINQLMTAYQWIGHRKTDLVSWLRKKGYYADVSRGKSHDSIRIYKKGN